MFLNEWEKWVRDKLNSIEARFVSLSDFANRMLEDNLQLRKENDILKEDIHSLINRRDVVSTHNSYLQQRLAEYDEKAGDTRFIRYMGQTYQVSDIHVDDEKGRNKVLTVQAAYTGRAEK